MKFIKPKDWITPEQNRAGIGDVSPPLAALGTGIQAVTYPVAALVSGIGALFTRKVH